ncbi:hypothetical protein NL676_032605 [Syzygium grande]|nr:hypothetical protein NL676_032605 [Syzygium grande]
MEMGNGAVFGEGASRFEITRLASVLVRTFVNLKKANHRGCLHLLEVVRCPPTTKSKEISSVSFVFYIKCPGGADVSGESSSRSPLECNLRRRKITAAVGVVWLSFDPRAEKGE